MNRTRIEMLHRDLRKVSVVAGHFNWGVWNMLPSFTKYKMNTYNKNNKYYDNNNISYQETIKNEKIDEILLDNKILPSIFVMGRHPVNKAISFYYDRVKISKQKPMNNMTIEELNNDYFRRRIFLRNAFGIDIVTDNGIDNSACRPLANSKGSTGMTVKEALNSQMPLLDIHSEQRALQNIEKCIIGLQERWNETARILQFWFPWLLIDRKSLKGTYGNNTFINIPQKKSNVETYETIREDLRLSIESMNPCDMKLHMKMNDLFEKQLSVINNNNFL